MSKTGCRTTQLGVEDRVLETGCRRQGVEDRMLKTGGQGGICDRGRSSGNWPQKWWGRSAVEPGPGGTGPGNGMDGHFGVLRTMTLVVHVRH